MWAAINVAANVAGMAFGIARRRHDSNATTLSIPSRTPQDAPNVRSRTSLGDSPSLPLGITNRFANMFIEMSWHCLLLSCHLCHLASKTLESAAISEGEQLASVLTTAPPATRNSHCHSLTLFISIRITLQGRLQWPCKTPANTASFFHLKAHRQLPEPGRCHLRSASTSPVGKV